MGYSAYRRNEVAMMRKCIAAILALLLLQALAGLAFAEEEAPATPTDLGCAHEHTTTVIYFFDSPAYTSVSAASHRVSGPAVVATVCQDCGETLAEEPVDNAEEIRPHSMKKGVCALCGYSQQAPAERVGRDKKGERTLVAQPDGSGLLFLSLTEQDLSALDKAKVKTLLVRGEAGAAVIAIDVRTLRNEALQEGVSITVELAEQEDGSLFADLSYFSAPGKKESLPSDGVSLRFYEPQEPPVRVALNPADGDELEEMESTWQEDGYWFVPYREDGTYLLLR